MEQDSGGEGRGGAARGPPSSSARRLGASPRTAEQLCSRLRLLRSAPPRRPPARPARPALPGPPPTELCRYHFRRERRARRRTPALCAGERKCSEPEPAGRNGRCPAMERLCRTALRARGPSRALGMVSARFLHSRRVQGAGACPSPSSATRSLEAAAGSRHRARRSHGRVPESPGHSIHSPGSLSRPAAVTISPDDTDRSWCFCQRPPPPPTRRTLPCKHLLWLLLWSCERHLSWSQFPNFCPGQECVRSPCVMKGQGSQRQLEEGLLTFFTECMQPE